MRRHHTWIALLGGLMLLSAGCGIAPSPNQDTRISVANRQSAQSITIVGASTPYPAIRLLGEAYAAAAGDTQIIFLDSSQSSGGIAGVKAGLAEIGTVTRPPKPEEAENNLSHREVAKDVLLVATHPSVEGVENLTTKALQDIFSGQVTNWQMLGGPDAEIIVLDRAEDTSAKRLLRQYYLGDMLENSANSILLRRELDVVEALENTPYSVGVISLAKMTINDLAVVPMKIDDIAPTSENLKSGRYAMHRTLGIVWYDTLSDETQNFVDFIFSEAGANTLEKAGFVPSFVD